jgi:hypothetical protein
MITTATTIALASGLTDSTEFKGNILRTSCSGNGPDRSTAKLDAIASCQRFASEYLAKTIDISVTSVETEKLSSLHSLVQNSMTVENLFCDLIKEVCADEDGSSKCEIRCKFDLNKVKTVNAKKPQEILRQSNNLSDVAERKLKASNSYVVGSKKSIRVTTIPTCTDILITGKFARTVLCSSNVVDLTIGPDDSKIIFRANKYKPKEISAKQLLEATDESIQVIFDN